MKKILTTLLLAFTMFGSAIAGDNESKSLISADKFKSEFGLASRNVFRGVSYGNSPSITMKAAWVPSNWFELGTYGNATLNGVSEGYGNQINGYLTLSPFVNVNNELKNITLTSDDFYYFNEDGTNHEIFDWNKETTGHAVEAVLKYTGKLSAKVAYTYFANESAEVKGVYLEADYKLSPVLNATVGYLTDRNDFMFQTKEGFTNVGLTLTTPLHVGNYSPTLKVSSILCPTYKTVAEVPGVGGNQLYLVAALTF